MRYAHGQPFYLRSIGLTHQKLTHKRLTHKIRSLSVLIALFVLTSLALSAQAPRSAGNPFAGSPRARVINDVDDTQLTVLSGNRHPLARPENLIGDAPASFRMERMMLALRSDPTQQAALDQLVAAQHDPASPYYHQWLTPEDFGQRFGVAESDVQTVVRWLESHGMQVEEVTNGRRLILFSGNAGQVAQAFHTQIRRYQVNGEIHFANSTDPQIPQALAPVVVGPVSLHDFQSASTHVAMGAPAPNYTSGGSHYLAPADLATIYDVNPLYSAGLDGSGQTVAIVGRTNIHLSDVRTFRSTFGLPANDPQIIINGADPGIISTGEETEAILDVEWSGAMAKNATIKFVVSPSTSTDGVSLSAQYIVNHNIAPVMSTSFGLCEAYEGSGGNAFWNSLWQQAAAEGITAFISSGDSGAAGCDSGGASSGTHGTGVNGLCSSPYSVCVGGTQFNDTASPGTYWRSTNTSGTAASALSYVPEVVWNESAGGGLWSGGGGASIIYSKPSWQTGPGVPADGKRDVPDVSLAAAVHDGYLIYINGSLQLVGGTSAASPAFAGLMSLVVQNSGARQGNANPAFYSLASLQQLAGGAAVFHDITGGNNTVPGVSGFSASTGYDRASGLGSIDANLLVHHWSDSGSPTPTFQVAASSGSVSVGTGGTANVNITTSVSGGFSGAMTLAVGGLPTGVTGTFRSTTVAAPGSGTIALQLTASTKAVAGSYSAYVGATSAGIAKYVSFTLTVLPAPDYTLTASQSAIVVTAGGSGSVNLTSAANSTFTTYLGLGMDGLPPGMTYSFSPGYIAAPGSGSTTLTLYANTSVTPHVYSVRIYAAGQSISHYVTLSVNVPSFTLTRNVSNVIVSQGGSGTVTATSAPLTGFNSSVSFWVSGLPSGVTASYSQWNIAAPGAGNCIVTLHAASNTVPGVYSLTINALGGGVTKSTPFTLDVPSLTFDAGVSSIALAQSGTTSIHLNIHSVGGFTSTVALSLSGVPSGVTATLTPNSVPGGSGSSTLKLVAASNAPIAGSTITVTASGGGITQTVRISLNVTRH
jgi:pseudomonalisin